MPAGRVRSGSATDRCEAWAVERALMQLQRCRASNAARLRLSASLDDVSTAHAFALHCRDDVLCAVVAASDARDPIAQRAVGELRQKAERMLEKAVHAFGQSKPRQRDTRRVA
jgi:hypothetical protein